MFSDVTNWWIFLGVFSVINIILLIISIFIFIKRKHLIDPGIYKWRRVILWFSGVYVIVCAFRSFLPRIDLERICLLDTQLSNMFFGRSITTIAELMFIAQCAILLHEAGKGLNSRFSIIVAISLLPLIVMAEGFSWYAMLSTNYLGSVIEESLWTVSGILLVLSFVSIWPKVSQHHRKFLATMIIFGTGFVVFMTTIDVPMYWNRWQMDLASGKEYLTLAEGMVDSIRICTVNFDPVIWRAEMPWMTLYFTAAVWVSISLAHAPNYKTYRKL